MDFSLAPSAAISSGKERIGLIACHWSGWAVFFVAFTLYTMATLGDVTFLKYYSLVVALYGIPLAIGGPRLLKPFLFPLLLVTVSIPLHPSINNLLTRELQLISSDIGVWFIRQMGMAALQDGNIIDLGNFVLLVEEACSGLRYLLPLVSLSLLASYYYLSNLAVRVLIFSSVIPLTILMNSLRIAVTGLIIKYYGSEAAEGFLHEFEGIVVFVVACVLFAVLLAIITIFHRRSFTFEKNFRNFELENQEDNAEWSNKRTTWALCGLFCAYGLLVNVSVGRLPETIPERESFAQFPLVINERDFYPDVLQDNFLAILDPHDYIIGDYIGNSKVPINLYMAYYESQREGSLVHSPSECLPAGGWTVLSEEVISLAQFALEGHAIRSVIEKDGHSLLVYYWINHQNKNYTKTTDVYLSLIKRMLLDGRTDGTLVRLIIPITEDSNEKASENELRKFINDLKPVLPRFLPL